MRVVLAVGWALLLASVLVRSLGHPSLPLMIAGAACFAVVWLLFLVGLFVGPGNRY